jgi:probable F420-dependent oxidoreductase
MSSLPSANFKIDANFGTGTSGEIQDIQELAISTQRSGFDAIWSSEAKHDPFLPLLVAAEATSTLTVGTSIAVAFARSPMTLAQTAYDLQLLTKGRFILGLGSQVKPHIQRRFSMPWSKPAPRMREYVQALKAIWVAWQEETPLRFVGEHYKHTLMTPFFAPNPHSYGPPPVYVAAVGSVMTKVAGEVADGVILHGFTTRRYIEEVSLPAVSAGLKQGDREDGACAISLMGFVVSGDTSEEMDRAAAAVRQQIGFYGSTPAYRPVLELHGWGELAETLSDLAREGGDAWATMGEHIPDAVLEQFAVIAPRNELAEAITQRFEGVLDRFSFYVPYEVPNGFWDPVVSDLRS